MPGVSSIMQLEPEIRDQITRLRERGVTVRDITEKLQELGADVSKSAVGRYIKGVDEWLERVRRGREITRAVTAAHGNEPSELTKGNILVLESAITDLMMPDEDGNVVVTEKKVLALSLAQERLTKAAKTNNDLRQQYRQEMANEAAEAVDRMAKTKGLSAETVNALKAEFLGIAKK